MGDKGQGQCCFFLKAAWMMLVVTMIVASFLVFALYEFSPGNVASKTLGPFATQAQKDILYDKAEPG